MTAKKTQSEWLEGLAARGVPSGPVNTLDQVFDDPQIQERGMRLRMPYPGAQGGTVDLIGNPIKFSETPVDYHRPPPQMGQHTHEVLSEFLSLSAADLKDLRTRGVI